MAGILGSTVRALGLVAIVAVMFSGVAEADNPCYNGDCSRKVLRNSAKAVAIHSDITEKNSVGGNPCYGECVQNCLDNCGLNFEGCATCPVICGLRDTCKHKINSAKPEEALVIQSDTIKKNTVENVAGNPCYAECVQDCLNSCSFIGCAACPAICGTHDTCKHKKTIEINSAKPEEALVIQSDTIKKNTVENVAGNPCYAECVQDCLNSCSFIGCAACPAICGTHDTCKHKKTIEINSAKPEEALVIQSDTIKKNIVENVAGNPCYAECVQDCLNSCSFIGCAACPAICGTHDTCKHKKTIEINSAKPEEALVIQSDTIKKNTVENVAGNPCYAECVQDCLNSCSFVGCAACPAICGTHDTCKHKKTIEINSGKEAVAIRSDTIEKNSVRVVGGNPCYGECVQDCLNNCGLSPFGCAACPAICGTHNTCKDVKKVEINSGKLEDVAKSHVGVEKRNILRLNTVADE